MYIYTCTCIHAKKHVIALRTLIRSGTGACEGLCCSEVNGYTHKVHVCTGACKYIVDVHLYVRVRIYWLEKINSDLFIN